MKRRARSSTLRLEQAGLTLVELMVAILIAIFMTMAVGTIYLNIKRTFNAQNGFSQLQDSERLALTMLTTTVQSAGYFVNPLVNTAQSAMPAGTVTTSDGATSAFTAPAQAIVGSGDGTGTGASSDTLSVQYQTASGDGLMNCQGGTNTSGAAVVWTNRFAVNANHELTCALDTGAATPLIGNVFAMHVLFGVDTDGDGNVDSYLPASAISAGTWSNVYTAQISLQFLDSTQAIARPLPHPLVQTIELMNRK
ncbi:MAG: PilW family protein [Proteobacteria bacterium]|nr:PilW family protein [Pseudomonadota bacterium]